MINKYIYILFFLVLSMDVLAKDCLERSGKYGNGIQYQDMFCRLFISADSTDSKTYRNITINDEGLIQVVSNFPGTTNSNSTGARVFYLFPLISNKGISEVTTEHLSLVHPSGAILDFDKNGRLSSPDLEMKVSKEINSQNKCGVEIEKYARGIVVDLGYRLGNTPVLNKNAIVTITDKNKKKCTMINSDINKISKDEAELIYKTNEQFHSFLAKKCPDLDISDLLAPMKENINNLTRPSSIGYTPNNKIKVDNYKRDAKPNADELEVLINKINQNANGKDK